MGKGICVNPLDLQANNGPSNWNNEPNKRRKHKWRQAKNQTRKQQLAAEQIQKDLAKVSVRRQGGAPLPINPNPFHRRKNPSSSQQPAASTPSTRRTPLPPPSRRSSAFTPSSFTTGPTPRSTYSTSTSGARHIRKSPTPPSLLLSGEYGQKLKQYSRTAAQRRAYCGGGRYRKSFILISNGTPSLGSLHSSQHLPPPRPPNLRFPRGHNPPRHPAVQVRHVSRKALH